ncbi:MAG: geranylgeranyl pyrophosphate synthase [Alphaproteobacteria bacterium]|nr:geranylgeranyl pyrophosphate synthase [Alphaproteobacteria bacterium]
MILAQRVERALETALIKPCGPSAPPLLSAALRHAVFPGGARVRPMLSLAVAHACGDDAPDLADGAAAAIELLHCASLAHDDLPCFDDADTRRGRPSVHAAFGEPVAVLAGDALIVLAFERLAETCAGHPARLAALLRIVAQGVGAPGGIVAGQAWESEPRVAVDLYHRAKTGALFVAATMAGAAAAGADPNPWRALGETLGEAYQVADDLLDAVAAADACDKPVGQDVACARPSAVADLGVDGALDRLQGLVGKAMDAVPPCESRQSMRELVRATAMRLAPKALARSAA